MGEYDLKRLEVAIQYINRMVSGRNPVTNRPAPENEVLINANVNRCMQFVSEVLTDVKNNGGIVGKAPRAAREPKAPKPSVAETFPYEILQGFVFQQDQQISYLLKQIGALLPEGENMPVQATLITDWLRENGYLVKTFMEDISKETTIPTQKGKELGIYSEKAGMYPNEYYRVFYNDKAQAFLIENFRRILTEGCVIRERLKKERREKKEQEKGLQKGRQEAEQKTAEQRAAEQKASSNDSGDRNRSRSRRQPGDEYYSGRRSYSQRKQSSPASAPTSSFAQGQSAGNSFDDDPDLMSLLSSAPADSPYDMGQEAYPYDLPGDAYDLPRESGNTGGRKSGYNKKKANDDFAAGFFEDGWENADEGLPW